MNNFKILLLAALLAVLLFPLLGPSTTLAGSDITFVHEGTSQGFTLGDEAFPGPYDFIITAVGDCSHVRND